MARGSQLSRQWQILKILEGRRFGISIDEITQRIIWNSYYLCVAKSVGCDTCVATHVLFSYYSPLISAIYRKLCWCVAYIVEGIEHK